MANALFNTSRDGFLAGEISWTTATIKAAVVRNYSFNPAHKFISDITGSGGIIVATLATGLTAKTATDGAADADDITFPAVAPGSPITTLIIFQASAVSGGADVATSAQRVIYFADGRMRFEVAATAATSAVTLLTEDLPAALATGSELTLVAGSGPATITTTALGILGGRSLTVAPLLATVAEGAVYEYTPALVTLPITPNGGDIGFEFDNGPNRIFRL